MKIYTKVEEPAPIRVLIPYSKAVPKLQLVVDCLRIQHVEPRLAKVGPGDEYWMLLSDMWKAGIEFFIVEQDVFVWQGAIQQLHECEHAWCTLPTMCHGRLIPTTFGCVKFGAKLMEQRPEFWGDIPSPWFHLDAYFADKMGWPFIRPHLHDPPATHLNEVQWPDTVSTRYTLERKVVWQSMEEGQTVVRVNFRMGGDKRRRLFRQDRGEHVAAAHVDIE